MTPVGDRPQAECEGQATCIDPAVAKEFYGEKVGQLVHRAGNTQTGGTRQ
jgi:hypothetical protein